ncbi:MAG: hypothetical protein QG582_1154 [Candidatus Thermoplasmatota archaeon]|nr:hypothetical protein [Candidatus Thermoplasmatota archaeon]
MRKRPAILGLLAMSLAMVLMLSASITGRAAPDDGDITFVIEDDHVVLLTDDMSVAISTLFPAAAVKETDALDNSSYGFVFSSILGYNESDVYGLVLDEVPYHASMEHATWTAETPVVVDEGDGTSTAYVSMHSLVDMNKRIAFEDGNPDPGTPGIEIIEGWAAVTVDFIISSSNFSSTFDGAIDEGLYPVNGSTELKFDITIDMNIPIDADHLALDIGLMMMDFGNFTPTAMDEQYIFEGFQSDEVSISDPYENETTEDDELIMHSFQHRDKLKQLFAFNDTDESSFFSWASGCMAHNLTAGDTFEDLLTYYRTDGEALKVYISAPITPETAQITHDPSLGVFTASRGGIIELPDGSIIGSSAMSTALGILVGAVVAGGTGVAVAIRRSASQDQSETVVLEKNRYYRGK